MEIAETMNGIEHGNKKVPIFGNCCTFYSLGFLLGTEAFPILLPILGFQNFFLRTTPHYQLQSHSRSNLALYEW